MALRGRTPLFAGIARNAGHSDLAVCPRLLRDPFDEVVVVRILVAVVAFGLGGSPRLRDHVHVTVCDEAPRVAGLYGTEPERRVGRLRRQYIRHAGAMNCLVMPGRGLKYCILARLYPS